MVPRKNVTIYVDKIKFARRDVGNGELKYEGRNVKSNTVVELDVGEVNTRACVEPDVGQCLGGKFKTKTCVEPNVGQCEGGEFKTKICVEPDVGQFEGGEFKTKTRIELNVGKDEDNVSWVKPKDRKGNTKVNITDPGLRKAQGKITQNCVEPGALNADTFAMTTKPDKAKAKSVEPDGRKALRYANTKVIK